MRRGEVRCLSAGGFHRMAYVEWGPEHSERVLVCAHGLARNGRDFDLLAASLAEDVALLAAAEGLPAHGAAALARRSR